MGRDARSAKNNIYYKARIEASGYNEKLKSRESAAEMLGVHASTLADYELGIVKCPQPDKVVLMADAYNAPELLNHYCSEECPIGCKTVEKVELTEIDRITIKTLFNLGNAEKIQNLLIDVMADGKITADEEIDFKKVMEFLDCIAIVRTEFKLWAQKNLNLEV